MKRVIALALFVIDLSFNLFSQTGPLIDWQNTIGGSNHDEVPSVQQTSDGGYIVFGNSNSNISGDKAENSLGGEDYWIVKLNVNGNIVWENTIGGSFSDMSGNIQQTSDGGYILGGSSYSDISGDKTENSMGNTDYWVVKLDVNGNISWQNTIGGSDADYLSVIKQTTDGGYILGGYSYSTISGDKNESSIGPILGISDYWIIKLDSIGNITWQNTIGGDNTEGLTSIQQTSDGGYILGGSSKSNISGDKTENSNGLDDYWVVKINSTGNIIWQNTIGGSNNDMLASIQQTLDGGYILGGVSTSNISGDKTENSNGYEDFWIIKLDTMGAIVWQNTIGGNNYDNLKSIQQTPDGGYLIGGSSTSNISGDKTENSLGGGDYWVLKLNSTGNIVWQNTIGGNNGDWVTSVQQSSDGGYILAGVSYSDISGDKMENSNGYSDYWVIKLADCTSYLFDTITTCDSYLLNGNIYTTTGIYTDTLINVAGCDSIITLNLTILNSTLSFDTITACDLYLWNGNNYTITGIYTDTIPNLAGCDSMMTLNLTILNSTSSFDTIIACDSYVWNGNTYTTTGIYTDTIPNLAGCDSVMTLNLTINPLPSSVVSCVGDSILSTSLFSSYQWYDCIANTNIVGEVNQNYSPISDGSYAVIVTNSFSCVDTSNCYIYVDSCHASFFSQADTITSYLVNIFDNSYYPHPISSYSFLWDFGDGNTSTLQFPTHIYDTLGLYFICLTISDGGSCSDMFCDSAFARSGEGVFNEVHVINPATVGIDEMANNNYFNLYPNPTSDIITIQSSIDFSHSEITILNSLGEVVYSDKNTNRISLEKLVQGIYYLSLKFAGGERRFKIIKN